MTWKKVNEEHFYRPQRSCGQGNVFTGVCLSTGGRVSASVHVGIPDPPDQAGRPSPPRTRQTPRPGRPPRTRADPRTRANIPPDQADTPLQRPGRHPPRAPSRREPGCSIRSTSGRYASYWNAFFYFYFSVCFLLLFFPQKQFNEYQPPSPK